MVLAARTWLLALVIAATCMLVAGTVQRTCCCAPHGPEHNALLMQDLAQPAAGLCRRAAMSPCQKGLDPDDQHQLASGG
jgi:hypothetical protein